MSNCYNKHIALNKDVFDIQNGYQRLYRRLGSTAWLAWIRIIIMALLPVLQIEAMELFIKPLPFENKLFTNQVNKVYQDNNGFLWFGTMHSLERWDGHWLRTFRSDNQVPNLLADNCIRNIAETPDLLWIAGENGLTLYDKSNGRFFCPTDKRISGKQTRGITSDGDSGIWIAFRQELWHCNSTCTRIRRVVPFSSKSNKHDISDIYLDNEGQLWIMCYDGTLLCGKDDRFKELPQIPGGRWVCTMFQDRQGKYWLGTWGQGLWQYIPQTNSYKQHIVINPSSNRNEEIFFCIQQDKAHGWLWLLSYNRVYVLDYHDGQLSPVEVSSRLNTEKHYTCMLCDRDGDIWLTAYDGCSFLSFNNSGMHRYPITSSENDSDDLQNVCGSHEWIWINSQRHGLQLINRNNKKNISLQLGLPEIITLGESQMPASVWVAQRFFSTAYRLQNVGSKVYVKETVDLEKILSDSRPIEKIVEDHKGTLWMLTPKNLTARAPLPDGNIYTADISNPSAIVESSQQDGIICATDKSLICCNMRPHHIACRNIASLDFLLNNENVKEMAVEPNGAIWIATSFGRTFRSDSLRNSFQPSPIDSLLHDGLVQDLIAKDNNVWAMNHKRLIHYNTINGIINTYPASSDNIEIKGFRHHALCYDNNGVLAGGAGGLLYIPNDANHYRNNTGLC